MVRGETREKVESSSRKDFGWTHAIHVQGGEVCLGSIIILAVLMRKNLIKFEFPAFE